MPNFRRLTKNFNIAISNPDKAYTLLKSNKFIAFMIILVALPSYIMWIEVAIDNARPSILSFFEYDYSSFSLKNLQQGSVEFTFITILFALISFVTFSILLSMILSKSSDKSFGYLFFESSLGLSINYPFYFGLSMVPALFTTTRLFSDYHSFWYSLIWVIGGLLGCISLLKTVGNISSRHYLSFKKGMGIALVFLIFSSAVACIPLIIGGN